MITKLLLSLSLLNSVGNAAVIKNFSESYAPRAISNLEDIITSSDFGLITDPSQKKINNKLESEYNIDTEQTELTNLTYSGVRVKAKDDSKDYFGSKYIKFQSDLTYRFTGKTKKIRKEAYNSPQEDHDVLKINYTPSLGKGAFTDYFKHIEFAWKGISWDNGMGGKGGNRYHVLWRNGDSKDPSKTDIPARTDNYDISDKSMNKTELYNRIYSGVNWMKSYAFFAYHWNNETINLEFYVDVYCYATAWNAMWAKVENQLEIGNLKFTK
ncbi:hypothetical protein SSABA_v1c03740 [Spiroplasma sabaudiense Ar-1343]|uniref:Uncharacterized protein n=1 Tax=Spiroplasma sabaudiense Ar-1343 TaxID=1276257 RepID=W6A9H7_9MOLU|nr:hypothetical protein [Spiroplasma sabaudiense]AHI53783.1 hypothetical protein SSABA_v1c03740 [Spiroplasma sabaudiense Ar-1343]